MLAAMKTLNDLKVGDYVAVRNPKKAYDNGPKVDYLICQVFRRTKARLHVRYAGSTNRGNELAIDTRYGKVLECGWYAKVATPELLDEHERQFADRTAWQVQYDRLCELRRKGIEQLSAQQLQALADAWEKIRELP